MLWAIEVSFVCVTAMEWIRLSFCHRFDKIGNNVSRQTASRGTFHCAGNKTEIAYLRIWSGDRRSQGGDLEKPAKRMRGRICEELDEREREGGCGGRRKVTNVRAQSSAGNTEAGRWYVGRVITDLRRTASIDRAFGG